MENSKKTILFIMILFLVLGSISLNHGSKSLADTNNQNAGKIIYLDGEKGNDDNDGKTPDTAVKTLDKAKLSMVDGDNISIVGKITINEEGEWGLAEFPNSIVETYDDFEGETVIEIDTDSVYKEVKISNINFKGTSSQSKIIPVLIRAENSKLTMENVSFEDFNFENIYCNTLITTYKTKSLLDNVTIKNCYTIYSPIFFIANYEGYSGTYTTMKNSTIENNYGKISGGIINVSSELYIADSSISNNKSKNVGAIASFTIYDNDVIDPNYRWDNFSKIKITNNSKIENNVGNNVGGILASGYLSDLDIEGGTIKNNRQIVQDYGEDSYYEPIVEPLAGGISVTNGARLYITGGTIGGNIGKYGGVYAGDSNNIQDLLYKGQGEGDNISKEEIREQYPDFALLLMADGILENNEAKVSGGGIYAEKGEIKIEGNAQIRNNKAEFGSGIYLEKMDYEPGKYGLYISEDARINSNNDIYLDYIKDTKNNIEYNAFIQIEKEYNGSSSEEGQINITTFGHNKDSSNRKPINENATNMGTKLVYYSERAGGRNAARNAELNNYFVPSKYMTDENYGSGYSNRFNIMQSYFNGNYLVFGRYSRKDITLIGGKGTLSTNVENQLNEFNINRLSGKDRYATSVIVSKEYSSSDTVVLASGEKYTDELTATVLANKLNTPILLATKDKVPTEVLNEIERLGATKVILIGGNGTLSKVVETELSKYNIERIGGVDRYETAVQIGERLRGLTGNKTEAILVDGTNFPDAIAMTSMGVEQGIPILLTEPSNLRDSTAKTIKDWKISKVTIGGGTVSVGSSIEDKLKETIKVDRIKGADRYETSVLVAKQVYKNPVHAVVASGEVFPDAIVGAPYAAKNKYPIVLSRGNSVPSTVMDYVNGR